MGGCGADTYCHREQRGREPRYVAVAPPKLYVPLLGGVYQPHVPHDFASRHCLSNSDEYPIDQILTIDCFVVEYETPSTYHILYVCGVHFKAYSLHQNAVLDNSQLYEI